MFERRTSSGERDDVIDGQVSGVVGGTLVARAPVRVLATPGAEDAGAEPLPGPRAELGLNRNIPAEQVPNRGPMASRDEVHDLRAVARHEGEQMGVQPIARAGRLGHQVLSGFEEKLELARRIGESDRRQIRLPGRYSGDREGIPRILADIIGSRADTRGALASAREPMTARLAGLAADVRHGYGFAPVRPLAGAAILALLTATIVTLVLTALR